MDVDEERASVLGRTTSLPRAGGGIGLGRGLPLQMQHRTPGVGGGGDARFTCGDVVLGLIVLVLVILVTPPTVPLVAREFTVAVACFLGRFMPFQKIQIVSWMFALGLAIQTVQIILRAEASPTGASPAPTAATGSPTGSPTGTWSPAVFGNTTAFNETLSESVNSTLPLP
jgi:hypothetical protein